MERLLIYSSMDAVEVRSRLRGVGMWASGVGSSWVINGDMMSYGSFYGTYGYCGGDRWVLSSRVGGDRVVWVVGGTLLERACFDQWFDPVGKSLSWYSDTIGVLHGGASDLHTFGCLFGCCLGAALCRSYLSCGGFCGTSCYMFEGLGGRTLVRFLSLVSWSLSVFAGMDDSACVYVGGSYAVSGILSSMGTVLHQYLYLYLGGLAVGWGSHGSWSGVSDFSRIGEVVSHGVWSVLQHGILKGLSDYLASNTLLGAVLNPQRLLGGGVIMYMDLLEIDSSCFDVSSLSFLGYSDISELFKSFVRSVGCESMFEWEQWVQVLRGTVNKRS